MKKLFFDRKAVTDRLDRKKLRALKRAGAFVRSDARQSMVTTKKAARPGRPPRVHSSKPNLRTILFAYDPATDGVVVGPVLLGSFGDPTVPQVHEEGGTRTVRKRDRKRRTSRVVTSNYPPRPYMGPALNKNHDKITDMFRDIL